MEVSKNHNHSNNHYVPNTNKIHQTHSRKKWFKLLMIIALLVFLSILVTSNTTSKNPFDRAPHRPKPSKETPNFVESKLKISSTSKNQVPKIAYLISGSKGDGLSLQRTVKALYHPLNQYALHLDLEAPLEERLELVEFVEKESVFKQVGNVRVVSKSNLVTYRGPTMVTNTLHAMAILLKDGGEWDWFINLSASDYPLVTQDDLLHVLSTIPRELNFIEHTSYMGYNSWKEGQRARPIIIDPGLYSSQKSDVLTLPQQRDLPTAFTLFTGSAWMMLSRPFVEYCLWGWDNLPRTVLMYYANVLSSPEGYFHTVICNVEGFKNTTVNHDLHFISWDNPPKQHPHFLTSDDYERMVNSNAPFARKFGRNETVLDKIDSELLGRDANGFVPGKWLVAENSYSSTDGLMPFTLVNTTALGPGPGADRFKLLVTKLLSEETFQSRQCTSILL